MQGGYIYNIYKYIYQSCIYGNILLIIVDNNKLRLFNSFADPYCQTIFPNFNNYFYSQREILKKKKKRSCGEIYSHTPLPCIRSCFQ